PNLLLMPDMAALMETYEGAFDPFFGVMFSPVLPSPSLIPRVKPLLKSLVPKGRTEVSPRLGEPAPGLTASPELITLREVEPIRMPDVELEKDLPELTMRELEDFLAEDFKFPEDPGRLEQKTPGKRRRKG
uniref:REC8 meiotic recombination protein b n=1 Tax=Pristiophorus japonicus TaxID=55135 RepID=UPI00398F7EA2